MWLNHNLNQTDSHNAETQRMLNILYHKCWASSEVLQVVDGRHAIFCTSRTFSVFLRSFVGGGAVNLAESTTMAELVIESHQIWNINLACNCPHPWKFCKNCASITPLLGISTPMLGISTPKFYKIQFGGPTPHPCISTDEICMEEKKITRVCFYIAKHLASESIRNKMAVLCGIPTIQYSTRSGPLSVHKLFTSCIRRCLAPATEWCQCYVPCYLFSVSNSGLLLFFHVGQPWPHSSVLGLSNIGHRALPKIWGRFLVQWNRVNYLTKNFACLTKVSLLHGSRLKSAMASP